MTGARKLLKDVAVAVALVLALALALAAVEIKWVAGLAADVVEAVVRWYSRVQHGVGEKM